MIPDIDNVTITPSGLAEKLSLLRTHDPGLKLFGASTHGYGMNPCLSREELQDFEESAGVALPEPFRDFLLRFGNGGAGPGYGLLSLKQSIGEFDDDPLDRLARPFIPPASAREKIEDREYPEDGLLPLAHMGCGHMTMLVITGSERGTIWSYLCGGDYEPYDHEIPDYPPAATFQQLLDANDRFTDELLSDTSRRRRFWDWYNDWLDETAQSVPSS